MVSTGGERDLGWSRPPTDGRPPSAIRRLGFTDLLDIPVPPLSLIQATTLPPYLRRSCQINKLKLMNESPINAAGGSESWRARGDGGRTCLAMAAGGASEAEGPALGLRGTDLRRSGEGWGGREIGREWVEIRRDRDTGMMTKLLAASEVDKRVLIITVLIDQSSSILVQRH
jgi:hypothetical protein